MSVIIISVCDKEDDRTRILKETSIKWGYQLVLLGTDQPWISNTYRLKIILNYLYENSDDSTLYLIVDAYDVALTGSANETKEKFGKLQADIVFSGESNYALWEKRLRNYYWNYYPNKFKSHYPFLNAGTIIGKSNALIYYLQIIFSHYELDINDIESMKRIKSDQYLITRFYVDHSYQVINFPYKIALDDTQYLLGCTGGRTAIAEWPTINKKQDYRFFYFERRFVKLFGIKNSQNLIRDFYFDSASKRITHKGNANQPILLHVPGSLSEFSKIWNHLHENYKNRKIKFGHLLVSLLAYIRSILDLAISLPIQFIRKNSLTNVARDSNSNHSQKFKEEIDALFQSNNRFIKLSKEMRKVILPNLPYFINKLKEEKFTIYTKSSHLTTWYLFGFNESNCKSIDELNLDKDLNILITDINKTKQKVSNHINSTCIIFPDLESFIEIPSTFWKYYPKEMPISL